MRSRTRHFTEERGRKDAHYQKDIIEVCKKSQCPGTTAKDEDLKVVKICRIHTDALLLLCVAGPYRKGIMYCTNSSFYHNNPLQPHHSQCLAWSLYKYLYLWLGENYQRPCGVPGTLWACKVAGSRDSQGRTITKTTVMQFRLAGSILSQSPYFFPLVGAVFTSMNFLRVKLPELADL